MKLKNLLTIDELLEAKTQSKWEIEDVLITLDTTAEGNLKKDFFDKLKYDYIDTPGAYKEEYKQYDGIVDYLESNMYDVTFDALYKLVSDSLDKKYEIIDSFMKKHANVKLIKKIM